MSKNHIMIADTYFDFYKCLILYDTYVYFLDSS